MDRSAIHPDDLRDAAEMVRAQIEARGITDARVLRAMRTVPRRRFVPDALAACAYDDRPLEIGHGQTISQPYIVAFMSDALALRGDERVLEVGTGSGYQAAVLGELAAEVRTIEIVEPLARRAAATLRALGCDNVHVRAGDGAHGWPEHAPFDAIIVTAAPDHVPTALVEQLVDGGRLIIPVGDETQELLLQERHGDEVRSRAVLPVRFVPLTGAEGRGRPGRRREPGPG